jgi:ABC-2 type transport system ATP-binding protein
MAISIQKIEKIYRGGRREGSVHALKPLTLEIGQGEVFGLLGPNGAGKTTLVKLLLGIVFPTTGTGRIVDRPIGTGASKRLVGYLPENHRYPAYLTGGRVLEYFGRLSGLEAGTIRTRSSELLEMVQMSKWRDTKVKKYSKGMMQRLGLAQALINDPRVVFLDEPTDGVDPLGRKEIREIILRLKAQGKTIFLNSHLLSEVEMICDRVAILNRGELVRIGTVQQLTRSEATWRIEVAPEQSDSLARVAPALGGGAIANNGIVLGAESLADLNGKIDRLRAEGILIASISPVRHSLEELFINIIETGGK